MHRPGYHFLPPRNWINDPNGLIYWGENYHLFYQYNPYAPLWGNIHWGHAVSEDLVRWQHLPIALVPTPGSADSDGCWSGVVIDNDGTPTALYTGWAEGRQRPCLATGDENLIYWTKHPGNPVIPGPPAGFDLIGFRDHFVWKENGKWFQLIGAGQASEGGLVLLYRSSDLYNWEYIQPLLKASDTERFGVVTGDIWECPSFFLLGGKHVLIVSVWKENILFYPVVLIGDYHEYRFYPQRLKRLDEGYCTYYAPQTVQDPQGRRLVWGWIQERRSNDAILEAGWAGMISLPKILSLDSKECLTMKFAPELISLRGEGFHCENISLETNEVLDIPIRGKQLEIQAAISPALQGSTGISILRSPSGNEEVLILLDWKTSQVIVNLERSSIDPRVERGLLRACLEVSLPEPVRLHIYLDHSVIEIIANDQTAITARAYPDNSDHDRVCVKNSGARTQILSIDVWELHSVW